MDDTVMSAVIPMTTPNTVRNDRILFSRSVSSAIFAFSPREIRMGPPFLPTGGLHVASPHPFRLPAAGPRWDSNLRLCLQDKGRRKRPPPLKPSTQQSPRKSEHAS